MSKVNFQGDCRLLELVKRLQLKIRVATDAALLNSNLTLTQAYALTTLASAGPLPCSALARQLGITRQSMQGLVKTLHEPGLLTKEADPDDARHIVVSLSRSGEEAARNASKIMREVEARMMSGLGGGERRQLLETLGTCLANLEDRRKNVEREDRPSDLLERTGSSRLLG